MDKGSYLDFVIEAIRRSDRQQDFKVLPGDGALSEPFAGWSDGAVWLVTMKNGSTFLTP